MWKIWDGDSLGLSNRLILILIQNYLNVISLQFHACPKYVGCLSFLRNTLYKSADFAKFRSDHSESSKNNPSVIGLVIVKSSQ